MALTFGIPSLDALISLPSVVPDEERRLNGSRRQAESFSVVGPDGTGKSILGLHLASRYLSDSLLNRTAMVGEADAIERRTPFVLYVSSDLTFESAQNTWFDFALHKPRVREVPFERTAELLERMRPWAAHGLRDEFHLIPIAPAPVSSRHPIEWRELVEFLPPGQGGSVGFLDLATHTAGDDWGLVNSILAGLPRCGAPHLVVIDSIAGFETYVGELDAYGLRQTRRARIAQSLRNAGRKAHLVFIVEEPEEGKRLPEEYVTDVVLRLRSRNEGGRQIRTVEIEKARSRHHALGEHQLAIRSKDGTTTGPWENTDEPRTGNNYVHVLHSSSHRNLLAARDKGPAPNVRNGTVCGFGMPYLDELLDRGSQPQLSRLNTGATPVAGLPTASVSAIIGPNATGKSLLGFRLISEGFRGVARELAHVYFSSCSRKPHREPSLQDSLLERLRQSICTPHQLAAPQYVESKPLPSGLSINARLAAAIQHGLACSEGALATHTPPTELTGVDRDGLLEFFRSGQRRHTTRIVGPRRQHDAPETSPPTVAAGEGSGDHPSIPDIEELLQALSRPEATPEAVLGALAAHPNLRYPAVLLTTQDHTSEDLADRSWRQLKGDIERVAGRYWPTEEVDRAQAIERFKQQLLVSLKTQIIVRRFDMDGSTPAAFFHVIQRNVLQASHLVFGDYVPPNQWHRFWKGDRIRLIIDDFSVVARLCPALSNDPSFLPFIVFWLEREGICSLFVHTDAVLPTQRAEDSVTRSLQSLAKKTIHTWTVPFEGQNRIAVAASATSDEWNGVVREIDIKSEKESGDEPARFSMKVAVTPKLELYSGLEEGKPRLVPLSVYLFSSTPRFAEYVRRENHSLEHIFKSVDRGRSTEQPVIHGMDVETYSNLRDRVHLPLEDRSQHTAVVQVDGFWALGSTQTLASQQAYLGTRLDDDWVDKFELFRGVPQGHGLIPEDRPGRSHGRERAAHETRGERARADYFRNKFYRSRTLSLHEERDSREGSTHPDRVPFMWDFGFIAAHAGAWEGASAENLKGSVYPNVKSLVEALETPKLKVEWREFFGACVAVCEHSRRLTGNSPTPFDFASTSSETLNALLLEVWLSEFVTLAEALRWPESCARFKLPLLNLASDDYVPPPSGRLEGQKGHVDLNLADLLSIGTPAAAIPGKGRIEVAVDNWLGTKGGKLDADTPIGFLALSRAWFLLIDVIDANSLMREGSSFSLRQPRDAAKHAVASRQWYRTACGHDSDNEASIILRLPGRFVARGDSFLASLSTSRSRLLAWQAMDLLSSRRANLVRLQAGLGLPVRDVLPDEVCGDLRTALRNARAEKGSAGRTVEEMSYEDLALRGASHFDGDVPKEWTDEPRWLIRSGIKDYDRLSRPLQKWLARLLNARIRSEKNASVRSRRHFEVHDDWLSDLGLPLLTKQWSRGWAEHSGTTDIQQFIRQCDFLLHDIKTAQKETNA